MKIRNLCLSSAKINMEMKKDDGICVYCKKGREKGTLMQCLLHFCHDTLEYSES